MNKKNKFFIALFSLFITLLFLNNIFAATASSGFSFNGNSQTASSGKPSCEQGQDIVIQVAPFGCKPATSDLLLDQDYPAYCKLQAIKVNPLIKIESIESITLVGSVPGNVSSISFIPANTAIDLTSSIFSDVGSMKVMLKQQPNLSTMPESVAGNLTVQIKYNSDSLFGVGKSIFYMSKLEEDEWERQKQNFSFWGKRGYLKVTEITKDKADIEVYSGDKKVSSVSLKAGETSNSISLAGSQCGENLKLKVESLNAQNTRVKLQVNSEFLEVEEGAKFLDNKCQILKISNNGINKRVKIKCTEDTETSNFELSINPGIIFNIATDSGNTQSEQKLAKVGDWLYDSENGLSSVYFVYSDNYKGFPVALLASKPKNKETTSSLTLADDELAELASLAKVSFQADKPLITLSFETLTKNFGLKLSEKWNALWAGKHFEVVYTEGKAQDEKTSSVIFGRNIFIIKESVESFTDDLLDEQEKKYYDSAKENYYELSTKYVSEKYEETTYGKKALENAISMAYLAKQHKSLSDLCNEFATDYPELTSDKCSYEEITNQDINNKYVTINGKIREISLSNIYEPTKEDYSAEFTITDTSTNIHSTLTLYKNKEVSFNNGAGIVKLTDLNDEDKDNPEATIVITFHNAATQTNLNKDLTLGSNNAKVFKKSILVNSQNTGYSFFLSSISFKKSAKISLISDSSSYGTKSNLSFEIGIEKPLFSLAPDQINATIKSLNNLKKTFVDISSGLEKVIAVDRVACGATIAGLTISKLATGGVSNTARQLVMRGAGEVGGWFDKCTNLVKDNPGEFTSIDDCLLENSKTIEAEVKKISDSKTDSNNKILELQKASIVSSTSQKTTTTENSEFSLEEFMQKYCPEVQAQIEKLTSEQAKEIGLNSQGASFYSYENWVAKRFTLEQLKNIDFYIRVLTTDDASVDTKKTTTSGLTQIVSEINSNYETKGKLDDLFESTGFQEGIAKDFSKPSNKRLRISKVIKFSEAHNLYSNNYPVGDNFVYPIYDLNSKAYYLLDLGDTLTNLKIIQTYLLDPALTTYTLKIANSEKHNPLGLSIVRYTPELLKNKYSNPTVTWFTNAPYEGLAAIVPSDITEGWYAAMPQSNLLNGEIASYDNSGNLQSFYLCNVGSNGFEEFDISDADLCELINLKSSQPYIFPILTTEQAKVQILKAQKAVKEANDIAPTKRTGVVTVNGQKINVGESVTNSFNIDCHDFMSAEECTLLFNFCDPVICPSSRCNLLGYKSKDVKQEGVLGGLTLCLPNFVGFGGDVAVPICLEGVKAGLDNLVSVLGDVSDCFQTSLDTGENIGVCHELYSVYLCNVLWEQVAKFGKNIILPTVINFLTGNSGKGGGEYSTGVIALSAAKSAGDYFINNYAINSKQAFISRSTDYIKAGVCSTFISSVLPSSADFLSSLVKSDSPSQFSGWFEESSLSDSEVPPVSHYKIFYHIYAGEDTMAYYNIYLRENEESVNSYQNSVSDLLVATGSLEKGDSISTSKDLVGTSGYKQLCISINGAEECGFKEVSTAFSADLISDLYVKSQAEKTDITTSAQCSNDYESGIIRICASENPAQKTDYYSNTEKAIWKDVGYCGNINMRCWINTDSVKDSIESTTLVDDALDSISESDLEALENSGVLKEAQIIEEIKKIEAENDSLTRIALIDELKDKVAQTKYLAKLLLLKGDAYKQLLSDLLNKITQTISPTIVPTTGTEEIASTLSPIRQAVLEAMIELDGTSANRIRSINKEYGLIGILPSTASCWDSIMYVYKKSKGKAEEETYEFPNGAIPVLVYSDKSGKKYTVNTLETKNKNAIVTIGEDKIPGTTTIIFASPSNSFADLDEKNKLEKIQPGDWLYIVDQPEYSHSVIFVEWINKNETNGIYRAKLFDWNDNTKLINSTTKEYIKLGSPDAWGVQFYQMDKKYRYFELDISDDTYPVYAIFEPTSDGKSDALSSPAGQKEAPAVGKPITNLGTGTSDVGANWKTTTTESSTTNNLITNLHSINGDVDLTSTQIPNAQLSTETPSVKELLQSSGIKGFEDDDFTEGTAHFLEALSNNKNYQRIDPLDMQEGDLIAIGKGCDSNYRFGIFKKFISNTNGEQVSFEYTFPQGWGKETVYSTKTESFSFSSIKDFYVHGAYRYIGDLASSSNSYTKYTFDRVITDMNELLYAGSITSDSRWLDTIEILNGDAILSEVKANKYLTKAISKLVIDDLISKDQCSALDPALARPKTVREIISLITPLFERTILDISLNSAWKSSYTEIDPSKAGIGDIALIRQGCNQGISKTAIITSGSDDVANAFENSKQIIVSYRDSKTEKIEHNQKVLPTFMGKNAKEEYLYKVYTLSGSLFSSNNPQKPITLSEASTQIDNIFNAYPEESKKRGSIFKDTLQIPAYSLIKRIVMSNTITSQECENIFWHPINQNENIEYVKNLIGNNCNAIQSCKENKQLIPSTQNLKEEGTVEKLLNLAEGRVGLIDSIPNILSLSGMTGISNRWGTSQTIGFIQSSSNFYKIDKQMVQKGDLIFIAQHCALENELGIVDKVENSKVYFYSNVDSSKLKLDSIPLANSISYNSFGDEKYIHAVYRYVKDMDALSLETARGYLDTHVPWTISSAYNEIITLNLDLLYRGTSEESKQFQSFFKELVFDKIIVEEQCKSIVDKSNAKISDLSNILSAKCKEDAVCNSRMNR